MSKENKIVLISLSLIFLLILGLGGYFLYSKRKAKTDKPPHFAEVVQFPDNPKQGDPGFKEADKTITIGSEGTYKGTYEKVEEGKIFFKNQGFLSEILLNKDEIALQCSTQSLAEAEEIDLSMVMKIKVLKGDQVAGTLPKGEPIVVVASMVGTGVQVHTIVMDAAKCPQ